jgi:PAS domain S-box-containing protein
MSARESSETVPGEIRNSLGELRTIIDTIPALAWSTTPDRSVDFVNRRWQDYTGQSREQSQGDGWETAIHPEDLPGLLSKWEESRDCVADMCEARLRRFDGVFRWFSLRREPLLDDSGSVTRWFGTGIDIEAIKQRETLHAAEKRTLELIADGASLKDVLDQLCSSIDVQVAPSVTTVLLRDPDRECLWHGGGLGVPHEWISAIIPVPIDEVGLCGRAAFLKERVVVPDVATDSNWPDEYRDLAIRNCIRAAWSEPIVTKDDEVLGTFARGDHQAFLSTVDSDVMRHAVGFACCAVALKRQECALSNEMRCGVVLVQVGKDRSEFLLRVQLL